MVNTLLVLFIAFLLLFILSFIYPNVFLFWIATEKRTRIKSLIFLIYALVCAVIFVLTVDSADKAAEEQHVEESVSSVTFSDYMKWARQVESIKRTLSDVWKDYWTESFEELEQDKIDAADMYHHLEKLDAQCTRIRQNFANIKVPESLDKTYQQKAKEISEGLASAVSALQNTIEKAKDMAHSRNFDAALVSKLKKEAEEKFSVINNSEKNMAVLEEKIKKQVRKD